MSLRGNAKKFSNLVKRDEVSLKQISRSNCSLRTYKSGVSIPGSQSEEVSEGKLQYRGMSYRETLKNLMR